MIYSGHTDLCALQTLYILTAKTAVRILGILIWLIFHNVNQIVNLCYLINVTEQTDVTYSRYILIYRVQIKVRIHTNNVWKDKDRVVEVCTFNKTSLIYHMRISSALLIVEIQNLLTLSWKLWEMVNCKSAKYPRFNTKSCVTSKNNFIKSR